ncbi:MAG: bifunctional glutamate N-acetyltransferase/amino-acid acetyltransferase ArgJ [Rhodobacterales bacterium]|nr:bifunctional glutamate N-acetyltransferase/amino-acid acetyltransferase ArgJ [Rhodobacterales bacterium]
MIKVSPLAPEAFPVLPPIGGVRMATAAAGLRYKGRDDLLLMAFDPGTTVGGVFTRSKTAAAPVDWDRRALAGERAGGLIVNAGNANAFTGRAGASAVAACAKGVAERLGVPEDTVFASSTGVIGEVLPHAPIIAALDGLVAGLEADGWARAARAIMTTDTFPKGATATATVGGVPVRINGICKGSGMIAPDMATMLAYVASDAAVPADVLQDLVAAAADRSFNAMTVDGDTSTNDTVLAFATGAAGNPLVEDADDPALDDLRRALDGVMVDLAQQIARDGEGASKFITITVTGAENDTAARRIGLTIANSPLVKTAVAGEDANWGRIVMAVGKAGEAADRDRLSIAMGGVTIARDGAAVANYDEAPVAAHMKGQDITIAVDVGVGAGAATVWTCDLTHGYIDINADYRS